MLQFAIPCLLGLESLPFDLAGPLLGNAQDATDLL